MVQASNYGERQLMGCCSGLRGLLSPKLFKALSDPKRLSLLVRLAEESGPCTVSKIAEGSGVDLSVVSRHLAILREAAIITCEKKGKEVWCVVQTAPVVKLLRNLADALEACCPKEWRMGKPDSALSAARKNKAR
jgi:DNA-binding transcriptional ArsR family regulator